MHLRAETTPATRLAAGEAPGQFHSRHALTLSPGMAAVMPGPAKPSRVVAPSGAGLHGMGAVLIGAWARRRGELG